MRAGLLGIALPAVAGAGYALIELHIQHILPYTSVWFYYVGMFIVLSTPWLGIAILEGNMWYWVFGTILAYMAEDATYWALRLTPPYSWGPYIVWDHVPLLYIPATVALVLIYVYKLRGVAITI